MNYLLIPGNPPAVHFYELWKSEIESTNKDILIQVSPYGDILNGNDSFVQELEILSHHQKQLEKFQKNIGKPVTLLGHSLGGFVALKLFEKCPDLIKEVILLHPFLRQPEVKGRLILKTVAALSKIDLIPKTLINNRHVLERFSTELPFVSNDEMKLSFKIAHYESESILKDQSPIHFDHLDKSKIKVYYHSQDIWCPSNVMAQLKDQIHSIECLEPHGFITEKKYRESLWRKISGENL